MRKIILFIALMLLFSIPVFAQETTTTTTTEPAPSTTTTTTTEPAPTTTTEPVVEPTIEPVAPPPIGQCADAQRGCGGPCPPCPEVPVTPPNIICPMISCPADCPKGCEVDANGCNTGRCVPVAGTVAPSGPPQPVAPPPIELPPGCKKVVDEATRTVKVICEAPPPEKPVCPSIPEDDVRKCKEVNGIPAYFEGPGGCKQFSCKFQQAGGSIMQPVKCPIEDELRRISDKCNAQGMKAVRKRDMNGCFLVECVGKHICPIDQEVINAEIKKVTEECKAKGGNPFQTVDQDACNRIRCLAPGEKPPEETKCPPYEEIMRMKDDCRNRGLEIAPMINPNGCDIPTCRPPRGEEGKYCPTKEEVDRKTEDCYKRGGTIKPGFDKNGCNMYACEGLGEEPFEGTECKPPPKDAFESCRMKGGELIVKQDDRGCTNYAKCVKRGDENNIEVEEVEEVPSASKLLSLALKLEAIKIDFDKLVKEIENIANYYASAGEVTEEQRFRKVASMFDSAKGRIDEIKSKMRERIATLTTEDIIEFKHDLKYLKDVVMEDVLYVMLSTEGTKTVVASKTKEYKKTTEVKREKVEGAQDCGEDMGCFMESLRVCGKAVVYMPGPADVPGAEGPKVEITGLQDKACVMKWDLAMGPMGKPYDMVCKYPKYVMGMRGPEDFLPYCEGNMVQFMKQEIAAGRVPEERPEMGPGPPPEEYGPMPQEYKVPVEYRRPTMEEYCAPPGAPCSTDSPCCPGSFCKVDVCALEKIPMPPRESIETVATP